MHTPKKNLKRTWENSPLCGGLGVLHRGGLVALCEFFRELTLAFFPEVWEGTPFCALIFFYELSTVSGWHNLGMWQCFIDCSSARGIFIANFYFALPPLVFRRKMMLVTLQFPIFLPRDLPSQFLKGGQQLEGKINLERNKVLSSL